MYVRDRIRAWQAAQEIMPAWMLVRDEEASLSAGYAIFRDSEDRLNYICDLGSRLELNFHDGRTINIVIEDSDGEEPCFTGNEENEGRIAKAASDLVGALVDELKRRFAQ